MILHERFGVSNRRQLCCLPNSLFWLTTNKAWTLQITVPLCGSIGDSLHKGPGMRTLFFMSWRHHMIICRPTILLSVHSAWRIHNHNPLRDCWPGTWTFSGSCSLCLFWRFGSWFWRNRHGRDVPARGGNLWHGPVRERWSFSKGKQFQLIFLWAKWPPFRRRHFQMHFLIRKCLNSDLDFTEVCSQGSN